MRDDEKNDHPPTIADETGAHEPDDKRSDAPQQPPSSTPVPNSQSPVPHPQPPKLSDFNKREILAILGVGCSVDTAANYVGCSPGVIQRLAASDPTFAYRLQKARPMVELGFMRSIQDAATKAQYWRAAAWALERCYPHHYARRGADVLTVDQMRHVLAGFADIVMAEVPNPNQRKAFLHKLRVLSGEMLPDGPDCSGKEPPGLDLAEWEKADNAD
ncbi:MAG: hypothetical protein JW818_08455 [Pirellulales bacterium]|nr:hypothetical protein [Pirellulales bacterium]